MKNKRRNRCAYKPGPSVIVVWLQRCLALLFCLGFFFVVFWLCQQLRHSDRFILHTVQVEGEFSHVDAKDLQETLKANVHGSFFTVNISHLRQSLMALPWVGRVAVRRVWPDILRVSIIEKQPVARWGDKALLAGAGEVLVANTASDSNLPLLEGPPGTAQKVYQSYRFISQRLMSQQLAVQRLALSVNGDWVVTLQGGVVLQLGNQDLEQRLQRFVQLYPRVAPKPGERIAQVDLRYHNGFAVGWKSSK
jgi:cell division protein FtsQ